MKVVERLRRKNMKKSIILIMVITVLSKFFGLFRDIALTYFYGATNISDIYLIAQTIPSSLFSIIGAGLATSFIPLYNRLYKEKGDKEASRFTSNIINVVFVMITLIIILVLLFTEEFIMLYASGFKGAELSLAVTFTRISIVGMYFSGIIYILNSYLHMKNNFIVSALLGFPLNFVAILSYAAASKYDNRILAWGIVLAAFAQFIILVPAVLKAGFKYKFFIDFKDKYLREILFLAVPVFIGVSVNQIGVLVDRNMASRIIEGGISSLSYARKLNGFIQGLFIAPIVTVIYPSISRNVIEGDTNNLKKTVYKSLVSISILVVPATVGAMVLSKPIVDLIFLRGKFDATAATMTASALKYYSLGMLVYAFRDIYARVFYSYNDTKTPMINAGIAVFLNIALNLILAPVMGVGGLALATSLSAVVSAFLLARSLKKKVPELTFAEPMVSIGKLLLASFIMGIVAWLSFNYFDANLSQNLALIASVSISAVVYALLIILLKIPEAKMIVIYITNKLKSLRRGR